MSWYNRPPLFIQILSWPSPWSDEGLKNGQHPHIKGHPDFGIGRSYQKILLPAEYVSKLLSEGFWKDERISQKTAQYFHMKPIFVSSTTKSVHNKDLTSWSSVMNPVQINPSLNKKKLSLSERNIVQAWHDNEACR